MRFIGWQERQRAKGDKAPETATDFEQLVMASPDSSFVWIKYIAFLISSGNIDNARATAERAIQTINYRWAQRALLCSMLNGSKAAGKPSDPGCR